MVLNLPPSPDGYQIEPELLLPTPRRVRERPYMAAWQLWLTRGAVLLFCFFCWLASMNLGDEHDWLRRQKPTTGYVREMSITHGKSTSYNVDFWYEDEKARTHEGSADVGSTLYNSLQANSPLRVYYADNAPDNWRLSPASETSIAEMQTNWYFGIGLGTVAAALGLWGFKGYRASRIRLLRDGRAAVAKVVSRRVTTDGKGNTYRRVAYTWLDENRATRTREIYVTKEIYEAHPEETPFTVIYLPDESYSSVPYFLIKEAVVEL